jgi:HD-GYP domain-containing protein (c-di-GMP phosphodiesterase class II)
MLEYNYRLIQWGILTMQELIGKTIKYDVVNAVGLVIIKANTEIIQEHLELVKRHHIDPFSIVVDHGIYLATLKTNAMNPVSIMTKQVVDQSIKLFRSIQSNNEIPVEEFKKTIVPTIQQISSTPNIFRIFEAIKAKDNYTHQHNIGVSVLATLIGKWLKFSEADLASLSLAGILHDVGKVKIPLDLLHKEDKLTEDEYKIVKQHTTLGYKLLSNTPGISHQAAIVSLQHHEREDGSGYPLGLSGDKIDFFSKIVAVADIFHAMSSKRPYKEPLPFDSIINQMKQGIFGELEPQIVSVFLRNITRKMVGTQVVLMDGRLGEIVYINPHDDLKPVIMVNNIFIDLSKERHLHIREIVS